MAASLILPAGFLCPVHTPDGAPCGLLNHMSRTCKVPQRRHAPIRSCPQIVCFQPDASKLPATLVKLGMSPVEFGAISASTTVVLDGRVRVAAGCKR